MGWDSAIISAVQIRNWHRERWRIPSWEKRAIYPLEIWAKTFLASNAPSNAPEICSVDALLMCKGSLEKPSNIKAGTSLEVPGWERCPWPIGPGSLSSWAEMISTCKRRGGSFFLWDRDALRRPEATAQMSHSKVRGTPLGLMYPFTDLALWLFKVIYETWKTGKAPKFWSPNRCAVS